MKKVDELQSKTMKYVTSYDTLVPIGGKNG